MKKVQLRLMQAIVLARREIRKGADLRYTAEKE